MKCKCECDCDNDIDSEKPCIYCSGGPYCDECWQAHIYECEETRHEDD